MSGKDGFEAGMEVVSEGFFGSNGYGLRVRWFVLKSI